MQQLVNTALTGLTLGMVYAAFALALVLIWRSTRIVNFAQAPMAMTTTFVGCCACATASSSPSPTGWGPGGRVELPPPAWMSMARSSTCWPTRARCALRLRRRRVTGWSG